MEFLSNVKEHYADKVTDGYHQFLELEQSNSISRRVFEAVFLSNPISGTDFRSL